MKNVFRLLSLATVLTILLSACAESGPIKLDDISNITCDYTGFSDIPDGYTADDALADGCLLIDTTTKPNQYGADVTDTRRTGGYEHWQSFLKKTENGEDAFLRIAHFLNGEGYYHDLYYTDGKYILFDLNEYGVSGWGPFRYLRCLTGTEGPRGVETRYYVLTDSLELTHNDVRWKYLSSALTTVTDIPFRWLTFMVYFD